MAAPLLRVLPLALLLLLLPTLPPPAQAADTCSSQEIETTEACREACKDRGYSGSSFATKNGAATCKCPRGDDKFRDICEDPAKDPPSDTKGSPVPIIIAVILVLAAVGGGCYWYYQKNGLPSCLGGERDSSTYSSTADSGI